MFICLMFIQCCHRPYAGLSRPILKDLEFLGFSQKPKKVLKSKSVNLLEFIGADIIFIKEVM